MTGPKDIAIAALAAMLVAAGIAYAFQGRKVTNLKTTVQLYEVRESAFASEIEDCKTIITTLQTAIEEQNAAAMEAAELGERATVAQRTADEYARRLAAAEDRLIALMEDQQRFDELVADADQCQTYELVLRSIVGEVP